MVRYNKIKLKGKRVRGGAANTRVCKTRGH